MNKHLYTSIGVMLALSACTPTNNINTTIDKAQVSYSANKDQALYSIETGHTITKVRSATNNGKSIIAASSYEGAVLTVDYNGNKLWTNELSGYMNHDIWAQDITGDGNDEILAANADGHIYCLSDQGKLLWSFKVNDAPMNSVTVIHKDNVPYVVAGGYDKNFYYLDAKGKLVKTIASSTYSIEKSRANKATKDNPAARIQPAKRHTINFLRTLKNADGKEQLVVHGVVNSMQGAGVLYIFNPLDDLPITTSKIKAAPTGDLRLVDTDGDGKQEVLLGSTKLQSQGITIYNPRTKKHKSAPFKKVDKLFGKFGYRIAQTEVVDYKGTRSLFLLYGNSVKIIPSDLKSYKGPIVTGKYSYNDMWKDPATNKIILASSQSGGSGIHILDIQKPDWDKQFASYTPPGNITNILKNIDDVNNKLISYKETGYTRKQLPVYLMSDKKQTDKAVVKQISKEYDSPIFLEVGNLGTEKWDRSSIPNKVYQKKRDRRKSYDLSQADILKKAKKLYKGPVGAAYWGGHGNDPYYRSLDTHIKTLNIANDKDKKTVLIFPEVAHYDKDFEVMLKDFMFPLAEASQELNGKLFLRNKHVFWQSMVYKPGWSRLLSGELADVFVPAMEETTDKSMELSIAARTGLWASGAVNNWGARLARDNTSFDRLRQHSHQMLPNHALRQYIYSVANGATYINNFVVDQNHMKTFWDLIGKGVLFVPKSNEILSYSPVHIGMLPPDNHYLDEGSSVKTTSTFDQKVEDDNPMVFSRLNGTWPGAPLTEWDFSRYAADVKERRLNFLPPYPNGLVLIAPPQNGVNADKDAPRGALTDHLHPIYKNIMQEYYTDGRDYVSADGKERFSAKTFYKTVEASIKEKSKLLPITVTGDVAWVVAQTSPKHLRLTLIDSGYINPKARTASVSFNTIKPVKITDLINGTTYSVDDNKTSIDVPIGAFRFIDIELNEVL